jgi:tRNA threonylcarbamoyladenosine biosynthesis protein TsaE
MAAPAALERHLISSSADATRALGAVLARAAAPGDLVCLWGELGAGKTQLAKGFGAGLGIEATINSPTFVLMTEYAGRLPLFHVDLYRLGGPEEAIESGLLDERQSAGVTVVEWPDRLGGALPEARLDVWLEGSGDEPRTISLRAGSPSLARYLAVVP